MVIVSEKLKLLKIVRPLSLVLLALKFYAHV